MKHCNTCGKANADEAQFCSYCGAQLTQTQQQNYTPGQQPYTQPQQPYTSGQQPYGYSNFNAEDYYARNNAFDSDALGKSRGIFALLAIFIGGLGVQYFYIGKTTAGLLTILLSVVTCGFWSLLTLIQGIILLCSDNYYFDRKFVYSNSALPLF